MACSIRFKAFYNFAIDCRHANANKLNFQKLPFVCCHIHAIDELIVSKSDWQGECKKKKKTENEIWLLSTAIDCMRYCLQHKRAKRKYRKRREGTGTKNAKEFDCNFPTASMTGHKTQKKADAETRNIVKIRIHF